MAQTPGPSVDERLTTAMAKGSQDAIGLEIPLPDKGIGSLEYWSNEISQSQKRSQKEWSTWKANLSRYNNGKIKVPGLAPSEVTPVNIDFSFTEQKKAQLFFQRPDIQATPFSADGVEAAALMARVLNYYLGADEINAEELMDEVLFDLICVSGLSFTKIGFEEKRVDKSVPTGQINSATNQPAIDPATGQPFVEKVPTRIWSRYFWEHIPATQGLIPARWTSTRYDAAPWLGHAFNLDDDETSRRFNVPKGDIGGGSTSGDDSSTALLSSNDKEFFQNNGKGFELYYKASLIDPSEPNPERYRRLVLIGSKKKGEHLCVVHENSKDQKFDQSGALVCGMRGNPIQIFTLRTVAESAYPMSDSSASRHTVDELTIGRSQMTTQRSRNLPLRGINKRKLAGGEVDRITKGQIQGLVMIDGDPTEAIKPISSVNLPNENFEFNTILMNDIRALWALGSSAQSLQERSGTTAEEIKTIQGATDTRLSKERNRGLGTYTIGAGKLSTLFQMHGDEDQVLPIKGQDGIITWHSWNRDKIQGRFLFDLKPDSSQRVDAAESLRERVTAYNLMAKDPHFNRLDLLKQLATRLGMDPAKAIVDQLPAQHPDAPKLNISIKDENLGDPSVIELLAQYGITVTAAAPVREAAGMLGVNLPQTPVVPAPPVSAGRAPAMAIAPHPGSADKVQPISQHEGDRTGDRSGPKVGV